MASAVISKSCRTSQATLSLLGRLKSFEKVLARLHDECRRSVDLMHDFLPTEMLAYIGQSLTFSAMSEALGQNVISQNSVIANIVRKQRQRE